MSIKSVDVEDKREFEREMINEELKTYRKQVEWLFEEYPFIILKDGRTDYTELDFRWLKHFGNLPYLELEAFKSLIRNLGKLQNVERASRKLREGKGNNQREKEYRRTIVRL